MGDGLTLAERLPPDTVTRLRRAGHQRFESAELLRIQRRRLAAVYLYGYAAEMWLSAAYFRSAGFRPNEPIERDTRQRRMAQARQLRLPSGAALMSGDPHPLVGWAQFLRWQRSASAALADVTAERLNAAVNRAVEIYRYWRPELWYKVVQVTEGQLAAVRRAAIWLKDNHEHLSEA